MMKDSDARGHEIVISMFNSDPGSYQHMSMFSGGKEERCGAKSIRNMVMKKIGLKY